MMISVTGLTFSYPGSTTPALNSIHLEMAAGEFVAVVGPSGCGKSTLGLALAGFLFNQYPDHVQGSVSIDGKDVRTAPLYEISDLVGLVQQNAETQFCTLSVQDELVFGLENRRFTPDEMRARIDWALQISGCRHLLERQLHTLSGGEKQKVAIAAMLAGKPQILIFDEPTSNLDPSATAEIFAVIADIRRQTAITVIVIEHKIQFLRPYQPRIIELRDGAVYSDTPAEDWQAAQVEVHSQPAAIDWDTSLLSFEGVSAGYNQHPVVQDIQLDFHPGEFVALMGDNGSGKTTLLRLALGFLRSHAGRVLLNSMDTRETKISNLARFAGIIFQNPAHQIFASSVWQEATFALENFSMLDEDSRAYTGHLLQEAGLSGRVDDHPYRLSYGQMRRLNLVSVFSYRPRIYLLDEILIGQDQANAVNLLEQLQAQTHQGALVIMVNHHPEAALQFATRIIFLRAGRIAIDQPTQKAFASLKDMGLHQYLPYTADLQGALA